MKDSGNQVWGNHLETSPEQDNVLFCAGRDVATIPMADQALLPYDIWTNRAHCKMLQRQGILERECLDLILLGLQELEGLVEKGEFALDPAKEDVHINVEAYVTMRFGAEIGGRMHTARSRNDQVACDLRLYMREACLRLMQDLSGLLHILIEQAIPHKETVMPGFTHYQPGMITTWAHWLSSYAQALLRDLERSQFAFGLINRNPLGAAASFGTSWPIDRQYTAQLLGFDAVEDNSLDCITARWENETQLAQVFGFVMNHLSVMAQDLIFLSHPYAGMIHLHDSFVTGSSIMPQKKNPDFAEVIKAKASLVHGNLISLMGIQKGGLSGYNRDTQLTKYLIMDVVRECEAAPRVLKGVFSTLRVNVGTMNEKTRIGFMNAVDVADLLSRELQLPFRKCYHLAAVAVRHAKAEGQITPEALKKTLAEEKVEANWQELELSLLSDPLALVNQRQHQGSPASQEVQKQLETAFKSVANFDQWISQTQEKLAAARHRASMMD